MKDEQGLSMPGKQQRLQQRQALSKLSQLSSSGFSFGYVCLDLSSFVTDEGPKQIPLAGRPPVKMSLTIDPIRLAACIYVAQSLLFLCSYHSLASITISKSTITTSSSTVASVITFS